MVDVFGVPEVGYESDLSGLIIEIPAELSSSHSASQQLFFLSEKVLSHIVGALNDGYNTPFFIQF